MKKPKSGTDFATPECSAGTPRGSSGQRPDGSDVSQAAELTEIDSEALLAGRNEIRIRHRGEVYRLTLTRAGKLILHK